MADGKFTIAAAQLSPRLGDLAANLALYESSLTGARGQGADLVVFPDLSLTGYLLRDMVSTVAVGLESSRDVAFEADLGFTYEEVDELLNHMVDERHFSGELEAAGFAAAFVGRVSEMVRKPRFGRRLPVIAEVSQRTIDRDCRYARDRGV